MNEKQERNFLAKFPRPETGCWNWTAGKDRQGYGILKLNRSMKKAHRVSYEYYVGPVPEGLLVCHNCDNPTCVNPTHLFTGTHQDNNQDKVNKGRATGAHKGSNNAGKPVLAEGIRYQSSASAARFLGVHWTTIFDRIKAGREGYKKL